MRERTAPGVSHVGVLWDSTNRAEADLLASLQAAASALGMTVLDGDARDATAIPVALTSLVRAGANGLYVSPSSVNASQTRLVVDFALAHRLPSIFGDKRFVSEGGLRSYWIDWRDLRRRSAVYVDKILKGAKPADLPVEQPTRFEMVINLKTAKALGLAIPQSLLLRADEVIR